MLWKLSVSESGYMCSRRKREVLVEGHRLTGKLLLPADLKSVCLLLHISKCLHWIIFTPTEPFYHPTPHPFSFTSSLIKRRPKHPTTRCQRVLLPQTSFLFTEWATDIKTWWLELSFLTPPLSHIRWDEHLFLLFALKIQSDLPHEIFRRKTYFILFKMTSTMLLQNLN